MRLLEKNQLNIYQFGNRKDMGQHAAKLLAERINHIIRLKGNVRIIFASAPSQDDILTALVNEQVDWAKVTAFHMDEYIGLEPGDSRLFSHYIKNKLFDTVNLRDYHLMSPTKDVEQEIQRYSDLLMASPIDICCMGIGENGHIAFNEPEFADFEDPKIIKEISLDPIGRQQQVNDGCFSTLNEVPKNALTLTIPPLIKSEYIFCTVPGKTKKNILTRLVASPITTEIPCTILKKHKNCIIFTDQEIS